MAHSLCTGASEAMRGSETAPCRPTEPLLYLHQHNLIPEPQVNPRARCVTRRVLPAHPAQPACGMQVQVQIIRSKADPAYKAPFTSMPDCVKQSFAANGLRAPFQGLGPTLLRNIPANSIYLGSFEVMKIEAAKAHQCSVPELPAWVVLSAAGVPPCPPHPPHHPTRTSVARCTACSTAAPAPALSARAVDACVHHARTAAG